MVERVSDSPYLRELNAMIDRAEAACERYRQAATQRGLPASLRAQRRERLQTMKAMLARLLAQRANAVSEAPVGKDARKGAA